MPPKAAPAPAAAAINWAPGGRLQPRGINIAPRSEVQVQNRNAVAGNPQIRVIRDCDIFTHNADCIVIGTDTDMTRRNEYPPAKFHTLAGPNLRRWNELCNYVAVPNPVAGRPPVWTSRLQVASSAVRAPCKYYNGIQLPLPFQALKLSILFLRRLLRKPESSTDEF